MSSTPTGGDWQRLDTRMLLVHPVKEVVRLFPALIGIVVAGRATGGDGPAWTMLGIAVPVGLGVLRYFTTSYRISGGRVELRRGLVNRHVLSTPLDRVRTVDVTASPIHRLLGLVSIRVGTGTASQDDDDRIDLDGLPAARAATLRTDLLRVSSSARPDTPVADHERVLLTLDPSWVRFAPFTSAGLVIVAAALGAGSQVWRSLQLSVDVHASGALSGRNPWLVGLVAVLVLVAVAAVLSVVGYLVQNYGLRLTHTRTDGSWHLRRGLFTTRETSMDDARVNGVSIGEPLALHLAGGARLLAIVTGFDTRAQRGSSQLVPPAPRAVVDRTAAEVLGSAEPVTTPLADHGPRARVRRWTRALVPALGLSVVVVWLVVAGAPTPLLGLVPLTLGAAAFLAWDRARSLGHVLVAGHLVARSGSLNRHREMLAVASVIGWNLRATWFQRRAGLTTLVATTSGGRQRTTLPDVPQDVAVALCVAATPDLLRPFLT